MQIAEVLVDRAAVEFRQDDSNPDTLLVPLPKSSSPLTVTVRGVASMVFDKPWQLPSVTARNAFWTEGASTLWIDPALELQSITPRAASLLNSVGVGSVEGGEAHRLQAWSSESGAEVIVAARSPQLHIESGVVAEFADRELAGRCQARLWTTGGPTLHVTAALEPDWNLESIEATPADSVERWHVAGEGRQRRLHVQLRRSPTELAPLRLAITARKPLRAWAPVATLRELEWIRFPGVEAGRGHLLVRDRRGDELLAEPSAIDDVVTLTALPPSQRDLLGESLTGLLFAAGDMKRDAAIRVVSTPPRFTAEAWIELTRSNVGFTHRAEIACRPVAGAVSELLVNASRPLPADVHWSLVGSDSSPVVELIPSVPPPPAESGAATPAARMQQYRVRFAQPQSGEFRLQATWRGESVATESVISLTLPGAEKWQSWAILRGDPATVRLDPRGCLPAAAVPDGRDLPEAPGVLGSFRLGDDPSIPLAQTPTLTAGGSPAGDAKGDVTCWLADVTTLQFADGNQTHRLAYQLEVHGADAVELSLPEGFEFVSARVDDHTAALAPRSKGSRRITVPLPSGRRDLTVTVDLHGQHRRLDAVERIAPPLPMTSFPVVRGRWTVAAPAPFAVESESQRHANAGWRQRLFGPLTSQPSDPTDRSFGLRSVMGAAPAARRGPVAGNGDGERAPASSSIIPHGWATATQEFVTAPLPMELRRIDDSRARWHVTWLCAAVAAVWQWPKRPRGVLAVAVAAAILCLVLPVSVVVAPQAVLLGAITGAITRELLMRTSRPATSSPLPKGRASTVVTTLVVSAMLISTAPTIQAADVAAPPKGVLFPIDADGKPAGTDVYAPASLLSELMPSGQRSRYGGAVGALVTATYKIELSQDAAQGEVICTGSALRLRLRTFRRNAGVNLPFDRLQVGARGALHTLDGAPIELRWNEAGDVCSLTVLSPGHHELLLEFIPRSTPGANQSELALRVPPLPGARVEVAHPAGLQGLTINAEHLPFSVDQPTKTTASVAGADALAVTWPRRLRAAASGVSVDQLTWLEVDPAVARVDVQLRLGGDPSRLDTLQIAASPQLKLLPLSADSPVEVVQTFPGSPTVAELKFRAPPRLPVTILLQFQVQRSVSLGHIDFPSVRVLGVETATHHFAASVDSRLRVREEASLGMTAAPVGEIQRLWGALPTTPSLQYAVTPGEPSWSMHVEPLPPRFTPRESLEVLCAADDAKVDYTAAISDVIGDLLTYRIAVPPALAVDDVRVALDDLESAAAVRWSRPRPDLVCVFLSRPLNEPHTLRLSGRTPYSAQRRLPLPQIGLESARSLPIDVSVRRASDVLVAWNDGAETPPPATTAIVSAKSVGILVGEYSVARNVEATPELQVEPNDAQLAVDGLLTLNLATPSEPMGTMTLRGRVTRGTVDRVRLIADATWRGPFVAEPQAVVVVEPAPGDAKQQVIDVRLAKPVAAGEEFTLKLSGAVALEADQRVRIPLVRAVDAADQRMFLVLPKTPGNQTAEWTLRGLERQPLPQSLAEAAGLAGDVAAFRTQRAPFVAEQRVFPDALRNAAVRLAETRLAVGASGDWSAVTQMVVQPGGASDVILKLPAGAELLHAAVDGRTIVRPIVEHDRWQAPAGPRYLPRVLTVGYRQRQGSGASRYEFQTPQVQVDGRPLVIYRSLWQVEGEPTVNLAPSEGSVAVTPLAYDAAVRREQLAAVVDAGPLAFQLPEWELKLWFQPWVDRLGVPVGMPVGAADEAQEAAWGKMLERIAVDANAERSADVAARPAAAIAEPTSIAYFQGTPGGELTLVRAASGLGLGRWILAIAIAGAWGAAWRYPEKRDYYVSLAKRWPAALGVLAGLAWWFILTPAVLGLAIIAFSLAALFKSRQVRRRQREQEPRSVANL
jgi:hypothetical protein